MQMLVIFGVCDLAQARKCHIKAAVLSDCLRHIMRTLPLNIFFLLLSSPAGLRIGKGEGYADLEYGMMASMGAVSESTVVVTIVHDCQVN